MSNKNYILTSEGSFISDDDLYHHGIKGMKWGRRKAVVKSGSLGTNRNNANRSKSSVAKAKNEQTMGRKRLLKLFLMSVLKL